jgi:hypothetical protein
MNDHGFVSFVLVMFEPSILYDYDKRDISMIIHYNTVYLVHLWLRQMEHIHDHSLPHRILGSPMTTTNGTYPWSLNQVFCVVMNDHGYVPLIVVMVEPSILCGNEWSWICFLCRNRGWTNYSVCIYMIIHYHTEYLVQTWLRQKKQIHDHSLPHIILGSTMTTTNETYPWSFITTQNRTKYSVW